MRWWLRYADCAPGLWHDYGPGKRASSPRRATVPESLVWGTVGTRGGVHGAWPDAPIARLQPVVDHGRACVNAWKESLPSSRLELTNRPSGTSFATKREHQPPKAAAHPTDQPSGTSFATKQEHLAFLGNGVGRVRSGLSLPSACGSECCSLVATRA
jgi:hypothetical protein